MSNSRLIAPLALSFPACNKHIFLSFVLFNIWSLILEIPKSTGSKISKDLTDKMYHNRFKQAVTTQWDKISINIDLLNCKDY